MRHIARLPALLSAALLAGNAAAAPLPATVTYVGSGGFTGDPSVLTDGIIPDFEQYYRDGSVSTDFGFTANFAFQFDFGGPQTIADMLFSVDNNDDYSIEFFNGSVSVGTLSVTATDGLSGFGFDTFATFAPVPNSGPGNSAAGVPLAFSPLTATSAVITGSMGDGAYGIGEVQFFAAVPEPASWALMIGGFGLVGGAMRRRTARVSFA